MPTTPITNLTLALSDITGTGESTLYNEIVINVASLLEGNNVLAVEVHKSSASEDDLSFDARIEVYKSSAAAGIGVEVAQSPL